MGFTDKIMRMIVAIIIGYLYYTKVISGTLGLFLGALAIIFVITSFISFCPLYLPFGIDTKEKNKKFPSNDNTFPNTD